MKIKNLSNQNLNLSLTKGGGEKIIISLKPDQVLYAEDNSDINKQLLIYEKKKLIYINREMDKPSFVDYYKAFFESGMSQPISKSNYIDLDDEDDDEVESVEIDDLSSLDFDSDDDFESDGPAPKRGRGRPKSINKKPESVNQEKKGRGRPKGSIKEKVVTNASENTEPKKGRGRPKGTTKIVSEVSNNVSEPKKGRGRPKGTTKKNIVKDEHVVSTKRGRGRPKGTIKKNIVENIYKKSNVENPETKKGRGRPKGSTNKVKEIVIPVSIQKVIGRKRGRPRK